METFAADPVQNTHLSTVFQSNACLSPVTDLYHNLRVSIILQANGGHLTTIDLNHGTDRFERHLPLLSPGLI